MKAMFYGLLIVFLLLWLFGGVLFFRKKVLKIVEGDLIRGIERIGIWVMILCLVGMYLISRLVSIF